MAPFAASYPESGSSPWQKWALGCSLSACCGCIASRISCNGYMTSFVHRTVRSDHQLAGEQGLNC
jgi:hypothetical protein